MKPFALFSLLVFMILGVTLMIQGAIGGSGGVAFGMQTRGSLPRGTIAFEDALSTAAGAIEGQVVSADFRTEDGLPIYGRIPGTSTSKPLSSLS